MNFNDHIYVFTDRSVKPEHGTAAVAYACPIFGIKEAARLNFQPTSTSTELRAIWLALQRLKRNSNPKKVALFTDLQCHPHDRQWKRNFFARTNSCQDLPRDGKWWLGLLFSRCCVYFDFFMKPGFYFLRSVVFVVVLLCTCSRRPHSETKWYHRSSNRTICVCWSRGKSTDNHRFALEPSPG